MLTVSFFLLKGMTAQAAALELRPDTQQISLESQFEVFEDTTGQRSLQDITQASLQQRFTPLHGNLNAGYTRSVYWLKMTIRRTDAATSRHWVIEMTPPMLDDIRLYLMDSHGNVETHAAGDHLPFSSQEIRHHYPSFQLFVDDTQTHTLYFRLQTTSTLFFRANLFSPLTFSEASNFVSGLMGIYYGIMLAMILYNGLLMISYRDVSMRYYLLLSVSTLLAGMSVNGHVAMYLAPDRPWLVDLLPSITPQCIVLTSSLFMCSFLKLKSRLPGAYLAFKLLQLASVLMLVSMLAGFQVHVATVAQMLGLLQIILYLPVSLMVARRGYAPGYIVSVASGVWLVGVVLVPLRNLGVLDSNWATDFGFQIGSAIEVILLALAQAYKIRLMQRERDLAQKELLKLSQRAEYELDAKVRLRTAELQQLIQRLEKSDKEKNDFLSIAVHDLKSPLTSMIGMSELLLNLYHRIPREEQQSYLSRINASGKRMMHIVTNLLDMNAMESGDLKLQKQSVNLSKLLNEISLQYEEMLKAKDLTAIIQSESDVMVTADMNAMTRVLDNLISNAIKFSPAGKFIWLTVSRDQEKGRFEVRDQGPGLSENDQQFLFTKFSRLSAVPTAGEHSSGLGLSIVKKLTEAQDGAVHCHSHIGEGASFIVELPLDHSTAAQKTIAQAA